MMKEPRDNGTILPGLKPVLELLEREPEKVDVVYVRKGRASADSDRILDLCRDYGVRFQLVSDDVLSRMAVHVGHQGVIARLREASFMPWEEFLMQAAHALDQVQDPGNVGTLARTLFAMGGAGLVLPKHNSAFLGPGARRSAAGALERLPLTQVVNLSRAVKDARDAGFVTCAAQKVEDSIDPLIEKLPLPALLVLGNEEKGVRPGVLKHCECSLCIPFRREFDSLNVAQAGAILISCFARSLAL